MMTCLLVQLGVELTPWLGFEAEYSQIKGDTSVAGNEYKGENIAGNFYVTSDLFTKTMTVKSSLMHC